jgi:hypothetical protein
MEWGGGGGGEGEWGKGTGTVQVSGRRMVKVKVSGEHLGVIVELQKLGMAYRHSREQL